MTARRDAMAAIDAARDAAIAALTHDGGEAAQALWRAARAAVKAEYYRDVASIARGIWAEHDPAEPDGLDRAVAESVGGSEWCFAHPRADQVLWVSEHADGAPDEADPLDGELEVERRAYYAMTQDLLDRLAELREEPNDE